MTPRLTACLAISALIGFVAAAFVVASGWGWILGLLTYSCVGSVATLVTVLLAAPREPKLPPAVRAELRVLA